MSKCKLWNPLGIFLGVKISWGCILVTNGLHILGLLVGFQNFVMHFLNEVLFQDVSDINDIPLLGDV